MIRFRLYKDSENFFMYFWNMTRIVLIGTGNLAFYFYEQFKVNKAIDLIQWYGRKIEKIRFAETETKITDQLSELETADLYLICVNDDQIESLSTKIQAKGIVAHCAGAVALDGLKGQPRAAVFYPLQTFSKEHPLQSNDLPFCIETKNPKDQSLLEELAKLLGGIPYKMNGKKRAKLHMIAVIANNFGNHLLHLCKRLCLENDLPFEIFQPLIQETYKKALDLGPEHAQTGPAIRNDLNSIQNHLDLLSDEHIKKLYINLTTSIQKIHEQSQLQNSSESN